MQPTQNPIPDSGMPDQDFERWLDRWDPKGADYFFASPAYLNAVQSSREAWAEQLEESDDSATEPQAGTTTGVDSRAAIERLLIDAGDDGRRWFGSCTVCGTGYGRPSLNSMCEACSITPADILRGAALYLRNKGWCQGDMFDLSNPDLAFPPACGLGGIRMAVFGTMEIDADLLPPFGDDFESAVAALADHLVLFYQAVDPSEIHGIGRPDNERLVAKWNDDPARNAAQVIAAFYGAAQEWDRLHPRGGAA